MALHKCLAPLNWPLKRLVFVVLGNGHAHWTKFYFVIRRIMLSIRWIKWIRTFLREFGVIFCWNHNFSEIFVTNQFRYNLHLIENIREYLKKGANSRSGIIRSVQIRFLIKRVKVVCSATKFRFSSFGKFILEGTTEKNVL